MATINLAPGTQYLAAIRRRRRLLFMLSVVLLLLFGVVWGGIFFAAQAAEQKLAVWQGELSSLERRIAEVGPEVERITLFEERLAAVDVLLRHHTSFTPVLKELERLVPPPTVLTNVTVDVEKAEVQISGTTPNVDEVAQALASLATSSARHTIFTSTQLESILRNEIKSAEGAPTVVEYIFKAALPFAASALAASVP